MSEKIVVEINESGHRPLNMLFCKQSAGKLFDSSAFFIFSPMFIPLIIPYFACFCEQK